MQNDELSEILRLIFLSEHAPDMSDAIADAILSGTVDCSPDMVNKIRKRFTEKLFAQKLPAPVKTPGKHFTFGGFLEAVRTDLHLAPFDIANALGHEEAFIAGLEKGQIMPWDCEASLIGKVMLLFRLHIEAVRQLVATSATVNQVRGVGLVSARSAAGKMSSTRGQSTTKALERFLAINAPRAEPAVDTAQWFKDLSAFLESQDQNDLIGGDKANE